MGESVIYTPTVGLPVTVDSVFDLHASLVDLGQDVGIDSVHPRAFFALSDLTSNPVLDLTCTFTARGVTYSPWRVEVDGEGGVYIWGNAVV